MAGEAQARRKGPLVRGTQIMSRKRVKNDYIAAWFQYKPVSRPAAKAKTKTAAASAVSSLESS